MIHAHDWMTFPAGLLLREHTGSRSSSTSTRRRSSAAARSHLGEVRAIEQAALSAAERVLCVSEASARTLRGHHAVERAKLRVLHNAYSPLPSSRATAERTGRSCSTSGA